MCETGSLYYTMRGRYLYAVTDQLSNEYNEVTIPAYLQLLIHNSYMHTYRHSYIHHLLHNGSHTLIINSYVCVCVCV